MAITGVAPYGGQSPAGQSFLSDRFKTNVNLTFNGIASAANLLTTLNGNLFAGNSLQEGLETTSAFCSKTATAVQGLLNGIIAFEKKNLLAMIGGLLELPIAFSVKGFNLFLARGISAGLNQFDSIISRTIKQGKDGKFIEIAGKKQHYDSFKKEGWIEGLKIIGKNFPRLIKELYPNPFKSSELFPRTFLLCSIFMILGPIISLAGNFVPGLYKLGATVRHVFGGLAAVSLTTDKKTNTNIKQQKEGKAKGISKYAASGIFWVLAAIPDVLKHYDFFSDRIKNGTELALCFDRLGGFFFIRGNQRAGEK